MVLWVPMALGVAVMLTGLGVVVYARSLADGSGPHGRRDPLGTGSSDEPEPPDSSAGLFADPRSTRWWGLGTLVVGGFLVVASAYFLAAR